MDILKVLSRIIPVVETPRKILSIEERIKYTLIVLILYFILGSIPLYGLSKQALSWLAEFSWIFGGDFGTIITLGISPIVLAAIILQLFVGGGIIKVDLSTPEGRARYNDLLRSLIIIFIILESVTQVLFGYLKPESPSFIPILILQLFIGSLLIVILDDFCLKWGITSGINLFILAAISKSIFVRLFGIEMTSAGYYSGAVPRLIQFLLVGDIVSTRIPIIQIGVTLLILALAAYLQSLRIEIPLTYIRMRGGIRWPIRFLYTSVIPVILLFAFWQMIMAFGFFLYRNFGKSVSWLIEVEGDVVTGGLLSFIYPRSLLIDLATGVFNPLNVLKAFTYLLFYMAGGAVLSYMWVHAAGMDPSSLARQIQSSGFSIFGYRDPRLLERTLSRYIIPASILGGAAVGFLAAIANIFGAVARGTALLLVVMIVYNLYEDFARQNALHLLPLLGKWITKQ